MFSQQVKLYFAALAAILFLALAGAAQSGRVVATPTPTPKEDDTVRVFTEEVKLNVLAFDENGNFFRDVNRNDIVITENNVLHQADSVRRIPANVLIVMDTGGDLRAVKSLDQTRKTARAVVNSLRDGDSIAVLSYNDKAEIVQEWTNDKAEALNGISKKTTFGKRSAFVDALEKSLSLFQRSGLENKHLILITDGTDSGDNSAEKETELKKLLATDITVHVLSYTAMETAAIEPRTKGVSNTPPPRALPPEVIAQLPNGTRQANEMPKVGPTISLDRDLLKKMRARKKDLEDSEKQLESLAENTNGEFILPTSLDEMIEKSALVSKMIDASYVVTYTPKIPLYEGKGLVERQIEVTSKRPGLIVQSKRKLVINTGKK
jgi:VWFA-related protein